MRVKATISYNGSSFLGFQKQTLTDNTVATTIELALKSLNIDSKIIASGRTDKGVHASGQVISFTLPPFWQNKNLTELKERLNQKLKYIKFLHIKEVDFKFHPQYDAKVRVYKYIIKQSNLSVFEQDLISQYKIKNIKLFKEALNLFVGKHNFKYFKKQGSPTTSDIREIFKVKTYSKNNYFIIYFFANGYLRSQIRLMIAAAIAVDSGKITLSQLKEQIDAQKKHISKPADGSGLYLAKIFY